MEKGGEASESQEHFGYCSHAIGRLLGLQQVRQEIRVRRWASGFHRLFADRVWCAFALCCLS